jgi:hypothetical protein
VQAPNQTLRGSVMRGVGGAPGIFGAAISRDHDLTALCARGTGVYRSFIPLLTDVFTYFHDYSSSVDDVNRNGCDQLHYLVMKYLASAPEYGSLRSRTASRIQESLAAAEEFGNRLLDHLGHSSGSEFRPSQSTSGGGPVEIDELILAEVAHAGTGAPASPAVLVLALRVEGAIEATRLLADVCYNFGLSPGQIRAMPLGQRADLAARMRKSANLKRFAELLGRWSTLALSSRAKRTPGVPEELSDVTYGDDWHLFVPQELSALTNSALRYDFFIRLTDRKVLQYEPQSREGRGKGPIVVCLDTSGSMAGDRDVRAKATTLALHFVARKQGRPFATILFSSPGQWVSFVFRNEWVTERAATGEESRCCRLDGIMKVATFFFGGGTDYESPLKEARRLIEEGGSKWREADIVFITDDYCEISDEFSGQFKAHKTRLCVKVFSVIVGAEAENSRTLWKFSDRVVSASAFDESVAAQIFEAV